MPYPSFSECISSLNESLKEGLPWFELFKEVKMHLQRWKVKEWENRGGTESHWINDHTIAEIETQKRGYANPEITNLFFSYLAAIHT